MTDGETTEAALALLQLQKGDMGRTKVPPKAARTHSSRKPSTSHTTNNTSGITVRADAHILEDTTMTSQVPKTPRAIDGDGTVQPGPYPTPVSAAQQPSKSQKKAQRKDNPSVKSSVKYGRWSPSGRSWFANRRSVPGDRPPPRGATYSYRPVDLDEQPRSPMPQERHSSVVSSVESEPIIARPRRRRLYQRSEALDDQTAEAGPSTVSEAEDSDESSVDSNPIIIQRRRRLPPIQESRSPNPSGITVGSYLNQQSPESPFRETSLASDLYEGVQNRVRRRNKNLRRSKRLSPRSGESSATPPIATRTRGSQGTTLATPSRLRSGTVRKDPIKLEASEPEEEAEETAPESPGDIEDPTEPGLEREEAVVLKRPLRRDRPPRPSHQRPSPQPSASWVRRSQRSTRAGPTNAPFETVEPGRMTLDEWVDEENALRLTPPYLSIEPAGQGC